MYKREKIQINLKDTIFIQETKNGQLIAKWIKINNEQ